MSDKVPKLSGSLAFYTIFSLGPMLLIMIFLANLFWEQQAVEGSIVRQLSGLIGKTAAEQVQQVIRNASLDNNSGFAATVGIITLVVGATTVFVEIQDSINSIWKLKLRKSAGWWKLVLARIKSFSIVVGLGFLLLVSLAVNGILEGLMDKLQEIFPNVALTVIYILNLVLTFVVTTFLFGVIFKVLPDAEIRWRDVAAGACFTAFLFMIGKFGISFYIGTSDLGSTYGAAGSLVVLLLWVYYSSMILYFGAEFTKAYAMRFGEPIAPNEFAVTVHKVEVESNEGSVQESEKKEEETKKEVEKGLP